MDREDMYRLTSIFIALVAACLALGSGFALGGEESLQPRVGMWSVQPRFHRLVDVRPAGGALHIREDVRGSELSEPQVVVYPAVERTTVLACVPRCRPGGV